MSDVFQHLLQFPNLCLCILRSPPFPFCIFLLFCNTLLYTPLYAPLLRLIDALIIVKNRFLSVLADRLKLTARKSEEFKLMRKFSLFRFCIKLFASKNCYSIQSTQKHRKDGHILQDKEIIRRIQQGNKELLRDVIEKYYDEILRFCIYQIKDPAYACDLTQETFYRFIRCVDTYQYKNLKKYLIAIARNLCVDYWHGNLPTEPLPEDDSLQNTEIRDNRNRDDYEHLEDQMMLAQLLSQIPEEQREVIVMRYYSDLKYRDIARILGVNLSTVKSRLRLGIANLQKRSEMYDKKRII